MNNTKIKLKAYIDRYLCNDCVQVEQQSGIIEEQKSLIGNLESQLTAYKELYVECNSNLIELKKIANSVIDYAMKNDREMCDKIECYRIATLLITAVSIVSIAFNLLQKWG